MNHSIAFSIPKPQSECVKNGNDFVAIVTMVFCVMVPLSVKKTWEAETRKEGQEKLEGQKLPVYMQ